MQNLIIYEQVGRMPHSKNVQSLMHGKRQVLSESKCFQIRHHTAQHHQNITQVSMKVYFLAPPTGFGLLSALILTFPPAYRPGMLESTLDLTLVPAPATLGTVEPAVEDTGTVFRFEAMSGTPGAVFALSGPLS